MSIKTEIREWERNLRAKNKYKVGFRHWAFRSGDDLDPNIDYWGSFPQIYNNFQDAWEEKTRLEKEQPERGDYKVRLLYPHEYEEIKNGKK